MRAAPVTHLQVEAARAYGAQQVLYTYNATGQPFSEEAVVEECGSMNIFLLLQRVCGLVQGGYRLGVRRVQGSGWSNEPHNVRCSRLAGLVGLLPHPLAWVLSCVQGQLSQLAPPRPSHPQPHLQLHHTAQHHTT